MSAHLNSNSTQIWHILCDLYRNNKATVIIGKKKQRFTTEFHSMVFKYYIFYIPTDTK